VQQQGLDTARRQRCTARRCHQKQSLHRPRRREGRSRCAGTVQWRAMPQGRQRGAAAAQETRARRGTTLGTAAGRGGWKREVTSRHRHRCRRCCCWGRLLTNHSTLSRTTVLFPMQHLAASVGALWMLMMGWARGLSCCTAEVGRRM